MVPVALPPPALPASVPASSGPRLDLTYAQIKANVQKLYDSGIVERRFGGLEDKMTPRDDDSESPEQSDLTDCSSIYDFYPSFDGDTASSPSQEQRFAQVAYQVVGLTRQLRILRYPDRVWKPLLNRWERGSVEWIQSGRKGELDWKFDGALPAEQSDSPFMQELSTTLNTHRASQDPSLAATMLAGGCGAGEVQVEIKTEPAGAHVQIIAEFQRMLCSARGIKADDIQQCPQWREVGNGLVPEVAGDYRYQASWPDGRKQNGFLRFETLSDGDTVTLRP